MSQAYCGVEPHGWPYLIFSFFVIWFGSDLWEFGYHYMGHVTAFGWEQHKPHHVFFNPSPFAVIADEALDQVRCMCRIRITFASRFTVWDVCVAVCAISTSVTSACCDANEHGFVILHIRTVLLWLWRVLALGL